MNKPYFYKIKNKLTGKYYVGSQYGKYANKDNFFTTYFTSSRYIQEVINNDGIEIFEILCICEREDAREYEAYYLQKCYRLLGKDKFLKTFYNRSLSPGILLDTDITARQSRTKKTKYATGELEKPIPPNWKGKKRSRQMRERLSSSKKGCIISEATREKLRQANLGKTQSAETKEKRAKTLSSVKGAYGRKHWLFISPDGHHYYVRDNRNRRLHELGLSEGPGFINYVNTGSSPKQGKNVGWLFYEGEERIIELIKEINKDNITYYE